jgi:uncharacterized integral membrane protein
MAREGGSVQAAIQRLGARGITSIVLGIVALVFIFENTRHTEIRFIGPQVSAPLWLALLIAAALGGVAGALLVYRSGK